MLPPEAQSIASAVVSLPVLETETVVGLATGVLGLRGTTDIASADPAAIAALHTQLKKLPPAVTHLLVEQLPKESQDLAAAAIELLSASSLKPICVAAGLPSRRRPTSRRHYIIALSSCERQILRPTLTPRTLKGYTLEYSG